MTAKRLFDAAISLAGLVLLSPLFILAAIWIKLDSPGPVFFRQERVGKGGKTFRIFKFRTMTHGNTGGSLITVAGDMRVTRSGAMLRKTKVDELPQLLNVLAGDMSLVGPRPEVPKYVALYPPESAELIFSVRPGITDRASIKFRNENDILALSDDPEKTYVEEILPMKIKYYEDYARDNSLHDDVRIIIETVKAVVAG